MDAIRLFLRPLRGIHPRRCPAAADAALSRTVSAARAFRRALNAGIAQALVALAFEPVARCSVEQFDVMQQWLRHLEALQRNAPPAVVEAVRDMVWRVPARSRGPVQPLGVCASPPHGLGPAPRPPAPRGRRDVGRVLQARARPSDPPLRRRPTPGAAARA